MLDFIKQYNTFDSTNQLKYNKTLINLNYEQIRSNQQNGR